MEATDRTLDDGLGLAAAPAETVIASRYRLRGVLGRGGMGTVYRAEDLELGELVALKMVSRGTATGPGLERQRDEVKLARRVTHPNVARTFDIGDHRGIRFITMELVDGVCLLDVIHSEAPFEARLRLLSDIAAGLAAIHAAGIAHRDLKPENVLISSAGVAKITDFGIARPADSLVRGMTTGTPRYMAPEVLAGEPPTPAADVYAFGLVAHELLTGARFLGGVGSADRRLRASLGPRREAVAEFLERCLADAPASRPPSTRPLEALLSREPPSMPLSSEIASAPRIRLGASVFAADEVDAWLSDSIPAELLRLLATCPGLEVVSALARPDALADVVTTLGIDVVVLGSVRRDGEQLRVSARVVSAAEQLQLWARTTTLTMATLAEGLRELASLAAKAVLDEERDVRTVPMQEPRVTELLLRASHEDLSPWRDFASGAPALLEEARLIAPDDPVVLATLAQMLLRGVGWDDDRYHRARRAAERAVELDGASVVCQLALAETLLVANDPLGAITSIRTVLRDAPSEPHAHAMVGTMAMFVGLLADTIGRCTLALALEPGLAVAHANAALAREYEGDHAAADVLVTAGIGGDAPFGRALMALTGARLAVWRGPAAVEQLLPRLAALDSLVNAFVAPITTALAGTSSVAAAFAGAGLSQASAAWALPRCFRLEIETEIMVHRGAYADAAKNVGELVAAGTYDTCWFTRCPMVVRLAEHVDLEDPRRRVEARAVDVRRALEGAGLIGAPRRNRDR